MRSGLAFVGKVGGHDDLFHQAVAGTADQALEVELTRTDAVERRQAPHQHIVKTVIGVRLFHLKEDPSVLLV